MKNSFFSRVLRGFKKIFLPKQYKRDILLDEKEIFNKLKHKQYYITSKGNQKALKVSYILQDDQIQEIREEVDGI